MHSFGSHLLQENYDIRTIQELLGHSDIRTTMKHTYFIVQCRTLKQARSPLDFTSESKKPNSRYIGIFYMQEMASYSHHRFL